MHRKPIPSIILRLDPAVKITRITGLRELGDNQRLEKFGVCRVLAILIKQGYNTDDNNIGELVLQAERKV